MEDYADVESFNAYQMLLNAGKTPEEAFKIIQVKSRDNSRTPMQWDDSENAGFTKWNTLVKSSQSYSEINVNNEIQGSNFYFYQN